MERAKAGKRSVQILEPNQLLAADGDERGDGMSADNLLSTNAANNSAVRCIYCSRQWARVADSDSSANQTPLLPSRAPLPYWTRGRKVGQFILS